MVFDSGPAFLHSMSMLLLLPRDSASLFLTALITVLDVAAGKDWHVNKTEQMTWAASYCRCPGCNGTDEGTCDECLVSQKLLLETEGSRTGDCDRYPPQYDCWMDVRTRASGWPIYDAGVRAILFFSCH